MNIDSRWVTHSEQDTTRTFMAIDPVPYRSTVTDVEHHQIIDILPSRN
jgi:hypothetical protein